MGKSNKKKGLSEKKLTRKRTPKSVLSNPFEIHINRSKFEVLGRKSNNDRGLPGVARAKSIKKRKMTLLQEYKIKGKSNKFVDRRIGENNAAMTKEDKIIARFTAERMKAHKRKTLYNLADDEVLTHRGKALAEIERCDDPRSDDDDDYDGAGGGLDAQFVEDAHFGGGMFQKSETSRTSVIDQLIADSKKRKAEQQQQKEKTLQMTEKLDSEWRELVPVLSSTMGQQQAEVMEKKDSFDILMNELKFSARGKPSDRLKSEEEIAAEEAKRLRELEEERIRRMQGDDGPKTSTKRQHKSADDLDDGFDIDDDQGFSLMYDKDGVAIELEKSDDDNDDVERSSNSKEYQMTIEESKEAEQESEDEDLESNNSDGEEDSGSESDDSLNDLKLRLDMDENNDGEEDVEDDNNVKLKLEMSESNEEGDEINEAHNNMDLHNLEKVVEDTEMVNETAPGEKSENPQPDKLSNQVIPQVRDNELPSSTQSQDDKTTDKIPENGESIGQEIMKPEKKGKKKVSFNTEIQTSCEPIIEKSPEELQREAERRQACMEEARKQLPFTFAVPKSYEELQELFKDRSIDEQVVIIERMIKCNHPSLGENNKELLEGLFAYLLQHLNDSSFQECWTVIDRIAPYMFDLTQFSPNTAANYLRDVLNEKYSEYAVRKHRYPPIEALAFLKLVPLLFPTSDRRHSVSTPAFVFMCDVLYNGNIINRKSISSGLFIVSLIIEYSSLSKRICPEALNFLSGIIHLATPPSKLKVNPPFKQEHKFLYLHEPCTNVSGAELKMLASDLLPKSAKIDNIFRVRSVYSALSLLTTLAEMYQSLPAVTLLFENVKKHILSLEIEKYPEPVKNVHSSLMKMLEEFMSNELEPLVMEKKRPKALRLYEPSIQPVYEGRKRKMMSDEKAEHEKLVHKYKKEMKGAIREVRRDRVFLNKLKIKEQIASDNERKRKVDQIYRWAAEQQSEFKKLKKKK